MYDWIVQRQMPSLWNTLNNDLCCVFSRVFARLRCKILFLYRFANFSSVVSNYLCDHCSHLISTLDFQWYSPCVLTQYINNGENVVVTFESCVRAYQDTMWHTDLPQICMPHRIRKLWHVCVENFFSPEHAASSTSRFSRFFFFSNMLRCRHIMLWLLLYNA